MRCPHCGSNDDKVIESRAIANGDTIRRRRECLACEYRFTSYEKIEERPLIVVKQNGKREPFDRQKLEKGLERALKKRPISSDVLEGVLNEIEDEIMISGRIKKEVPSKLIGEATLARLYNLDKVAYVRFASVYKHFEDLDEFIEEVKKVRK